MDIEYTTHIWKEDMDYIAHAMPLDVMSSGKTIDEARKALSEAVHLFLVTASDMGTLHEVLQDAGYVYEQNHWVSPVWVSTERQTALIGA